MRGRGTGGAGRTSARGYAPPASPPWAHGGRPGRPGASRGPAACAARRCPGRLCCVPASPPAVTPGGTLGDPGPGPASASTEEGLAQQPPAQPRPPEQEQLRLFSLWCSASRLRRKSRRDRRPRSPVSPPSGLPGGTEDGAGLRVRVCVCACVLACVCVCVSPQF